MAKTCYRHRERPATINPTFDSGAIENPSRYDGDQSDTGSSTMSGPSTNAGAGHQLATSGFEPIVSQATQSELQRIESRLQQLERDEEMRNAARTNVLMIRREHDSHLAMKRKREDDEFRAVTENAEAEEEVRNPLFFFFSPPLSLISQHVILTGHWIKELRKQRKKLKRESMGLFMFSSKNSPEAEPSPMTAPAEPHMWASVNLPVQRTPAEQPAPPQTPQPYQHPPQYTQPSPYTGPRAAATTPRSRSTSQAPPTNGVRQRKYHVKNRSLYDNRHGPADSHDKVGRPLWKRPSDGTLVYLSCPFANCRKSDFRTIHGFTVHMTRFHKDRTSRGHSSIVETFGTETPNSGHLARSYPPPPPRPQQPPVAETPYLANPEPAVNDTAHFVAQNNVNNNNNITTTTTTPPIPAPNHIQEPVQDPAQEPVQEPAQEPVQSRQEEQETGYHQTDLVFSDADDEGGDEETPQIKVESDLPGDENPPAAALEQTEKNGNIQP